MLDRKSWHCSDPKPSPGRSHYEDKVGPPTPRAMYRIGQPLRSAGRRHALAFPGPQSCLFGQFPSLQPLGPDARPSQISGARACRASVALHHHPMDSCHSFALLATTSPRCSGTPLWRRKGSRARTPSRFIWSASILCNTASTVASHGAKYQPRTRRVNLRGTMRILAHCIDK